MFTSLKNEQQLFNFLPTNTDNYGRFFINCHGWWFLICYVGNSNYYEQIMIIDIHKKLVSCDWQIEFKFENVTFKLT